MMRGYEHMEWSRLLEQKGVGISSGSLFGHCI